jgi:hypothetical protein
MKDKEWMHEGMQTRRSMLSWMEGRNEMVMRVFGLWTKALQIKNLGFVSTCPTPDKACFKSHAKARQACRELNLRGRYKRGMSCYLCRCGKWHHTSRKWKD